MLGDDRDLFLWRSRMAFASLRRMLVRATAAAIFQAHRVLSAVASGAAWA